MAWFFQLLLAASLVISRTVALQVTPNSQCASLCIDDATQDKSDPNVSNTKGSDIICHDTNYATALGQKFQKCVDCLQNSSDKSETESDLQWYLYNIRYAINSCVYGLHNASDPLSSPCSIQTSCGPLVGAFQDGMDQPNSGNRFSYCTAFGNSFSTTRLTSCQRCLRLTDEQKYMGNFIVALKAGCTQQPEVGKILGLDGTLFSDNLVNETSVVVPKPTEPTSQSKGGLTTGAYAGIAVGGAFILAFIAAVCLVGRRKRKAQKDREMIASGLDNRFGNGRITAPVQGAYGDPYEPQASPYQNVGLVNFSPKHEKEYGSQVVEHDHHAHEAYFASPNYQRPLSTLSQNHNLRGVTPPVPYPTYNPAARDRPTRTFSPTGSAQQNDSPSHSPRSLADSLTKLNKPSPTPETSNLTRKKGPPVIGTGLTRNAAPYRSNSVASVESFKARPSRQTRDLSVSRDMEERNEITGPIVTVDTRFDEDENARRKTERERLYKQGFRSSKPEEKMSPDDELWPGKY